LVSEKSGSHQAVKPPPIALITGAAGGIGETLVHTFGAKGYRVWALDCVAQPDHLVCDRYWQVDLDWFVQDEDYRSRQLADLAQTAGAQGVDALINNAAVQVMGGVDTLTTADWHLTLNVNLLAPFLLTQGLLAPLAATGGCVVNISSIHARLTKPDFVAYATSKAALSGLTRAMAVDLGDRIRVNAIEPAAISTPMLKAGFESHPEQYAALARCHPQGRMGTPTEVAALALSLVSGELRFMHGACVGLDGGISARLHDPS
jgi:NAD(P)-dependent dehydrogenase (short-subunit alcohol dehydrogenase family)